MKMNVETMLINKKVLQKYTDYLQVQLGSAPVSSLSVVSR